MGSTSPSDALALLDAAHDASGMSWESFAENVLVREATTVHRWRRREVAIPAIVLKKLRTIIREAGR